MSPAVRSAYLFAACLFTCVLPMQVSAFEGSWQAGLNLGISRLSPDTDGSAFSLDDEQSSLVNVYVALDVTPIFSAELAFTDLGEADLSNRTTGQGETIDYQAFSIGATAYVWGAAEADVRSNGASAFVRLGLSVIDNDSSLDLDEENNAAIWLAAGVQFPMGKNWGIRAELANYDGDAQALLAGLYWRADDFPSFDLPSFDFPTLGGRNESSVVVIDANCPPESARAFDEPQTCGLLNSVVPGLTFNEGSAEIQADSTKALDRVAAALKQNPRVIIEIRAHVAAEGDEQFESQLSADRGKSVARYLVQNGVPLAQLRAIAFGGTRPLESGSSPADRQINNRIQLRTL